MRSPPRWTKWSRGVRTRGLRVGAVGGPRPLLFYGPSFARHAAINQGLLLLLPADGGSKITGVENSDVCRSCLCRTRLSNTGEPMFRRKQGANRRARLLVAT